MKGTSYDTGRLLDTPCHRGSSRDVTTEHAIRRGEGFVYAQYCILQVDQGRRRQGKDGYIFFRLPLPEPFPWFFGVFNLFEAL